MRSLSRWTRTALLCVASLSCAPDPEPAPGVPVSPLAPHATTTAQGLEGYQEATYQYRFEAPGCTELRGPSCWSTAALTGRGATGPEQNAPNTLIDSKCADGDDGVFHADGSVDALRLSTVDGRSWLAAESPVKLEVDVWGAPGGTHTLLLFQAADATHPQWVPLASLPTQGGPETLTHTFTLLTGQYQAVRAALVDSAQSPGGPCTPGAFNDHDDLVFLTADKDTTPPEVHPDGIQNGDTVAGPVRLKATASDDQVMDRVDFLINGVLVGSVPSPFEVAWDSDSVPVGPATYVLEAWDTAGNHGTWSGTLNVIRDAPPTVSFTAPTPGSTVVGRGAVQVEASDDVGVQEVSFFLDDRLLDTDSTPPYATTWDSALYPNGAHTLKAVAKDGTGKTSSASVTVTTDNDKTPPTVAITSPAQGATVQGIVSFAANASDERSGVSVVAFYANGTQIGSDTSAPYVYTLDTRARPNGPLTLAVKATDGAGNSSPLSTVTVTLDNDKTPPTVTLTSPAQGATVQGAFTLTADASDARSGISRVEFYVNGSLFGIDSSAPYSSTLDARSRPNGPLTLLAKAIDGVGNTSTSTVTVTLDNDRTPPTVAITSPAQGATVRGSVTLTVDASDARSGIFAVECYVDSVLYTSDTSAPYSCRVDTYSLSNGGHTFVVNARDGVGNLGTSAPVTVTVDNDKTPPTVALSSPVPGSTVQGTVTLTADASDALSGISVVAFYVNGTLLFSDTSAPYAYPLDTRTQPNGSLTLVAKARDGAGNLGTSASVTVTVDNDKTPPTVAITSPAQGAILQGIVSFAADASDARSGIARVDFFPGDNSSQSDTSAPYSIPLDTRSLPNGGRTLQVRAWDGASNTASTTLNVTIDNEPPLVALTSPAQGATVQGTVTLTADASDMHSGVARVDFYVNGTQVGSDTSAPFTYALDTRPHSDGSLTLVAKATDGAGNESTATVTVTSDNDRTPPTVAITSPANGATVPRSIEITADASDARSGITQVEFYVDSVRTFTDTSASYSYLLDTQALANGTHTLVARATDGAGNVSTSAPVTFITDNDKVAPTVAITSPAQGASVRGSIMLTADASDAQSGVSSVLYSVNGSLVCSSMSMPYSCPLDTRSWNNGPLTLGVKAIDGAGNTSTTTTVTVTLDNDWTAPTVALTSPAQGATVQGTITLTADASDAQSGIDHVDFQLNGYVACTVLSAPYACSLDTRGWSNGSHNLFAKAVDRAGNQRAAMVTVTLDNDRTPPTLAFTSPANGATVEGIIGITANASDARSGVTRVQLYRGNVLVDSRQSEPYAYTLDTRSLPNGPLTLTLKAWDGEANQAVTSMTLTLDNDKTGPTVSLTSPAANATLFGTVQVDVSASDARGGVARVEFFLGTTQFGTDTSAPFSFPLNTRQYANGSYSLVAKAYDDQGNPSTTSVPVTLANDDTPPTVFITSPANNAVLDTGTAYPLNVSASDNVGVDRVEFYLDYVLLGTDRTAPYSINWTPSSQHVGSRHLMVIAYDAVGNFTHASAKALTIRTPPSQPEPPLSGSFTYSASNTGSATANTVNKTLALVARKQLTLGTCGITGASFSGDTYLRLYDPSGTLVASNDDACGGAGSNFFYVVPTSGNYQVRAGCYSSGSCSATVAWIQE